MPFRWLPIEGTSTLILCIKYASFFTYRALKVAGNYHPERRKMGFDLRAFGAMLDGIYHKKCCLQSLLLLLASIGFVIKSRLPLMSPSSLASIAFVMTGVLARLSISLNKHWICNDKSLCMSVRHSQQALLLSIQMCSLRVCDS